MILNSSAIVNVLVYEKMNVDLISSRNSVILFLCHGMITSDHVIILYFEISCEYRQEIRKIFKEN